MCRNRRSATLIRPKLPLPVAPRPTPGFRCGAPGGATPGGGVLPVMVSLTATMSLSATLR